MNNYDPTHSARALDAIANAANGILDKPLSDEDHERMHSAFGSASCGCDDMFEYLGGKTKTEHKAMVQSVIERFVAAEACKTRRDFALMLKPYVARLNQLLSTIERSDD